MSEMNPISSRDPLAHATGSKQVWGASPSEKTAVKVSKLQVPHIDVKTGLSGRQISLLRDTGDLYKRIKSDWNLLAPEELAEKIIELENKVTLFNETSPAIEKIKKQAEHLHFLFVFPVALEMDAAPTEKSMPVSFARTIYLAANKVFKTNSVQAFNSLNRMQKQEVMRYAVGG